MDKNRRLAVTAGALYLATFVSAIPALALLGPILDNPTYVLDGAADTRVTWGALLDLVNAVACIGTAVALYPVIRRQSRSLALGLVTSRVMEAAIISIGVVTVLAVLTLRQSAPAAADDGSLVAVAAGFVAVRDWTFLLGPGFIPAANALLLGTILYRSRLVPRIIPVVGLIGAPLLLIAGVLSLFGLNTQTSAWSALATVPIFLWELSVGLWLLVKGFRREALERLPA